MAAGTYAQRIARLERCREGLRAQLALLAPGSRYAETQLIDLLEYVSGTLVILRQRAAQRADALAAVTKLAPSRDRRPPRPIRPAARPSLRDVKRPAAREVERVPSWVRTVRDEGVEFETTWTGDAWRTA